MKQRPTILLPALAFLLLFAQGCTPSTELMTTGDIDPAGGLSREDYLSLRRRDKTREAFEYKTTESPPPIPSLPTETTEEDAYAPLNKRVSITVNDSVPVRDIIIELAKKTDANIEIDPNARGNVILTAKNQPLKQVLKRICSMTDLRFTSEKDSIRIEPDEPYQKSYRLDYINLTRKSSSDTSISTNVFDVELASGTSNGSRGSSSAENNSSANVNSSSEADFWAKTEKSIAQILKAHNKKSEDKSQYSVDPQSGIITVYGTQKQQDAVNEHILELRKKSYAQVLIDARIIEVELDEGYQSGIDWSGLFKNTVGLASSFGTSQALGANGFFTAEVTGSNFSSIINLVQNFGATRVLSAPRITVLNNQTAVMKVATNQVYFVTQAQFTTTTNANGASITTNPIYTSTPRTVPVGLVMTVQPAIDIERSKITMTLRPTISRVVGQVADPSIGLNAAVAGTTASVQSQIPVLAVREMDSVIQLHSGEIAVLGGLMQDSSINQDTGIPGMGDIPYMGNLFKSRDNKGKTSELVILLRASIADTPKPEEADGDLYKHYHNDPRPLPLPNKSTRRLEMTPLDPDDFEDEL